MPNTKPAKVQALPRGRPIVWIVLAVVLLLVLTLPAFWSALQRELRQQRSMKALSAQLQSIEQTLLREDCTSAQAGAEFTQLAGLASEIHLAFPELLASAPTFAKRQLHLQTQAQAAAGLAASATTCGSLMPSYQEAELACESCHRALRGNAP